MISYSDDHPVRRIRALAALRLCIPGLGSRQLPHLTTALCCHFRQRHRQAWPRRRLQESKHQRRVEPNHLPKDAPNILIILLDDVGFGLPDTFGGPIHTPTLSTLANEGISYNTFHTTSICSPTRAALLTGRNHQRVGSGTIAERAVDWDGYTGVIPEDISDTAESSGRLRLQDSRLRQMAQHACDQTTAMGPFDLWPTGEGIGFDYFYGFLAGETSQWEPRLVENLNAIEPPARRKISSERRSWPTRPSPG